MGKTWRIDWISVLVAVITGVIANIVFAVITKSGVWDHVLDQITHHLRAAGCFGLVAVVPVWFIGQLSVHVGACTNPKDPPSAAARRRIGLVLGIFAMLVVFQDCSPDVGSTIAEWVGV